jgi:hypothetical protein
MDSIRGHSPYFRQSYWLAPVHEVCTQRIFISYNLLGLRLIEKAGAKTAKKPWWKNGGMATKASYKEI